MPNATITPEVREILESSTITDNLLVLPNRQLDRKLYVDVNKVLEHAGGKWNRGLKGHVFKDNFREKLGFALETGVSIDQKKQYQAFYTPKSLAQKVVALADVRGHIVLEPSAGEGALADECVAAGALSVRCVELNREAADKLAEKGYLVDNADFLNWGTHCRFNRIVMNSPFTKKQDIKHVNHALSFLEDDGILVAIVQGNREISDFKIDSGHEARMIEVEGGAFKESGTMIKTCILVVET